MPSKLEATLATFRRQMAVARAVRWVGLIAFIMALAAVLAFDQADDRRMAVAVLAAVVVSWILLALRSIHLTREVQAGGALLSIGKLDDAEVWLHKGMRSFSVAVPAKLVAGELLAMLSLQRDAHHDVIAICRELLRHPLTRVRSVWVNTRLMLADSLLTLDRLPEAHEAILPIYSAAMPLETKMKLLPIQLRYELSSGQTSSSVNALAEKVRIAELLDSPHAALVHALLAEACRRQGMPTEQVFLTERARLYHDLDGLVTRFPVIAPVTGHAQTPTEG